MVLQVLFLLLIRMTTIIPKRSPEGRGANSSLHVDLSRYEQVPQTMYSANIMWLNLSAVEFFSLVAMG